VNAPSFRLHLVIPGPVEQRTGGYLYGARIVRGLRSAGWHVGVHEVFGSFPEMDARAAADLDTALGSIREHDAVVLDGLAMGGAPEIVGAHADRLALIGLVHHPLSDETGLGASEVRRYEATERAALAHMRGVVVTSPFTARRLLDFGVRAERIRTILPGTDPALPAVGPGQDAPPRLVCVATVTPRKGHDVLVRALAALKELDWQLDCAGSLDRAPDFAAAVRRTAGELGLARRIRFLGELRGDPLEEVYRTASLFVLASHYEGYGMAYAEALARGLPVIGTTGGAIPQTVPPGVGHLVPPGDPGALAQVLRALLTDHESRSASARAARRHAERLPGWGEQAEAFGEAVLELASAGEDFAGAHGG